MKDIADPLAARKDIRFGYDSAIMHLKVGNTVARAGWNGKNMFIWLNKGSYPYDQDRPQFIGGVPADLFDIGDNGTTVRMPNLNMRAADGSTVTGWLASQTDMLAEDWTIVAEANQSDEVVEAVSENAADDSDSLAAIADWDREDEKDKD